VVGRRGRWSDDPDDGGRFSAVGLVVSVIVGPSPVVEGGVIVMLLTAITRRRLPITGHRPPATDHWLPITGYRPSPATVFYLAYAGSKLNLLATKSLTRE
jgi:hypothetical protein